MATRTAAAALFLVLIAILPGGCPSEPATDLGLDLSPPPPPSATTDGAPQAASGNTSELSDLDDASQVDNPLRSTVAAAPDFDAALQREFPACTDPARAAPWRDEVLRLVNLERQRSGLAPLARDVTLEDQAAQYACEMITHDFFAHVNPVTASTLADRAQEFGYAYRVVGENLAAGQLSPEQAFNDWMDSPGHRANIMDARFTEIGIAVKSGGDYGLYWVQEFGLPRD